MPDQHSDIVLAELERILASASFRQAKRSQDFLRYIVTNTLEAHYDALKERVIGAVVFQKPIDYDTADDSAVRVKASELRKRLAQFYMETGLDHPVTIALPTGSYVPEFRWAATPVVETGLSEAIVPPRRILSARLFPWIGAALCAAALSVYLFGPVWAGTSRSALDQFWQPVFDSPRPVLLCVASPVMFGYYSSEISNMHQIEAASPDMRVSGLIPSRDFIGIGDAYCLAHLSGLFVARSKAMQIRQGNEVTFADLRNSPTVLIGSFTNQWTMKMTGNLRFTFQIDGQRNSIHDQRNPSQRWDETPGVDYALISRLFDSRTGDMLIGAAGLGHAGTELAGEFIANRRYMDAAFHAAPRDWNRHNLQIVLKTEKVGITPGQAKVVAIWYW
ncbi:MAG: hypothetical protein ABSG25_01870 [Bryobacteraceae bacterium]